MSKNKTSRSFLEVVDTGFGEKPLVVMCGLPATCKTWAASLIATRHRLEHLRTDMIRKEILRDEDIFDNKVASDMGKRQKVYNVMFEKAEKLAPRSRGVILDATFVKQALRERAAEIASRHAMPLVIIHTDCRAEVALERISNRSRDDYESNALTEAAYYNNLKAFEPIDLESLIKKFPLQDVTYLRVETSEADPDKWVVIEDYYYKVKNE